MILKYVSALAWLIAPLAALYACLCFASGLRKRRRGLVGDRAMATADMRSAGNGLTLFMGIIYMSTATGEAL